MWLNDGTPATDATTPGIGRPSVALGATVAFGAVGAGTGPTLRAASDGTGARDGAAGDATPGVGEEVAQAATRIATEASRIGRLSQGRRPIAGSPYARRRGTARRATGPCPTIGPGDQI